MRQGNKKACRGQAVTHRHGECGYMESTHGTVSVLRLVEIVSPKVFPCLMDNDSGEEKQREEVRDSHEGVEYIGDVPDHLKAYHRSDIDRQDE